MSPLVFTWSSQNLEAGFTTFSLPERMILNLETKFFKISPTVYFYKSLKKK